MELQFAQALATTTCPQTDGVSTSSLAISRGIRTYITDEEDEVKPNSRPRQLPFVAGSPGQSVDASPGSNVGEVSSCVAVTQTPGLPIVPEQEIATEASGALADTTEPFPLDNPWSMQQESAWWNQDPDSLGEVFRGGFFPGDDFSFPPGIC